MTIAEKIKAVCKAQKTTLFALETKLGLGNGTIGKWGKNGRVPNYSNLAAVCSELGVPVEEIMRDDDVVPTSNKNAENAKKAPATEGEGLSPTVQELFEFIDTANDAELNELSRYAQFLMSKR